MTIEELNATLNKPSLIWWPTDRGITWVMGIPQSIQKIREEVIYSVDYHFFFCAISKQPFIYYNGSITLNLQTPCFCCPPMEQRAFFIFKKKHPNPSINYYTKEDMKEKDYKLLLSVLPIAFNQ